MRRSTYASHLLVEMEGLVSNEKGASVVHVLQGLRALRVRSSWSWIRVNLGFVGVAAVAHPEFEGAFSAKIVPEGSM